MFTSLFMNGQFSIYNIQVSQPVNANMLVDQLVGLGVTYSNPTFTGSYSGTSAGNAGFFSGGTAPVGIGNGIILSTGNVGQHWYTHTLITQANTYYDLGTETTTGGDATLQGIVGATTYDRAVLEFDFVPESNFIEFRYVFASEEYNEWVNNIYNDVFGFFVTSLEADGYNYSSKNIAIVPGTPNTAVAINNVNNGPCADPTNYPWEQGIGPCTNCAYYIDNTIAGKQIEYDGLTTVLTASCAVTPCKHYHMKIAIADVSDQWLDSGVLLEAGSFTSPVVSDINYTTSNPAAGNGTDMVEGCSNGSITFSLSAPTPINRNVPFTLSGSAQFGVDYSTIPDISGTYTPPNNYYVTIPQNQSSTTLTIVPILDGSVEVTESVDFAIQTNMCGTPIISSGTVYILDNSTPFSSSLPASYDICEGNSATLTASINGGQTPLSYSWSTTETTNPITVTPSSTTNYSVTITDACGITTTASTAVNVNPVPTTIPSTFTQSICSGSSTNISLSSNVPTATYTWTTSALGNITGYADGTGNTIQQTLTNNDATPGTVTYTITASVSGCIGTPQIVTVTVNPIPVIDTVITTPITVCTGNPDGTITIQASGGNPPYNYSVDGSPLQSSNVFTGLDGSIHNAMVQDANGCQATYSNISISSTSGPSIVQVLTTDLTCFGVNSGIIVINATGADEYSIDNGNTWLPTDTFINLPAGTYNIIVRDLGNCTAATAATINSPSQLNATFTVIDELCGTPGSAHISVTGGVAPYSYLWNNTSIADSIYNVYNGTYMVTVTDQNNCSQIFTTSIGNIPAPTIDSIVTSNISCYNGNNGSITILATGATQYSIDNGVTWGSNSTFSNLPVGTYQVIIHDSNNCTDNETITLTAPADITAQISTTPQICETPGSASVIVSGGIGPYQYNWSNGSTVDSIYNVNSGIYLVTVSDANGCTKQFTATIDHLGGDFQINYTQNNVLCHGDSTGSIQLSISTITPPYLVNWSHTSDTSLIQQNLPAGPYNVTVSDAYGCTSITTINIIQPVQSLSLTYQSVDITCANANDGLINLNVQGGTSPYIYVWSNGGSSSSISPLAAGLYSVTVTDSHNCTIQQDSILITNPLPLTVEIDATNPLCHNEAQGIAIATASGGTLPYQYQWTGGIINDTLSNVAPGNYIVTVVDAHYCTMTATTTLYNPPAMIVTGETSVSETHQGSIDITVQGGMLPYTYLWSNNAITQDISGLGGGTYMVTITDANNCMMTDTFKIDIPLEIPTVITPNKDGKNDDFEIVNIQAYSKVSIEIYGRWGEKLFTFSGTGTEYADKNNRWDGKYNGKDLPMGSYVYIIKLNDDDPLTGVVCIIR